MRQLVNIGEKTMKVSDYIVEYLINKGITDAFGYPGGMVTHLMESFSKYNDKIKAHVNYHEQASAFAACGYAQASGKVGVAYATSGPGATNLITGICNAYFDSIPCLFITGQVNTFESKGHYKVRQRGFQETDVVNMIKDVTKYSAYVESEQKIKYYLDKAFYESCNNRPGPVLLDIPMNIFRAEIDPDKLIGYKVNEVLDCYTDINTILVSTLKNSKKPCFLIGNGVKISRNQYKMKQIIDKLKLPVVSSMIAFDTLSDCKWSFGFIGAYGNREANFIAAKSDLIISIGSRLDIRQVGVNRSNFAPDAKILRIEIDDGEISYKLHDDEIVIKCDILDVLDVLNNMDFEAKYNEWRNVCLELKKELHDDTLRKPNYFVKKISHLVPENALITTDVGQNQVWVAQSFDLKNGQEVLFSGGHGAMGYSLPASIGAYYANRNRTIVSINGDGGIQMNIQELQFIAREQLPIKIIVFNNAALGMIRHFQEMYFNSNYFQTKAEGGYTTPELSLIANAYGIRSFCINDIDKLHDNSIFIDDKPVFIELKINENTYVFPKLEFGKPNQDQEPLIDRAKYERLMNL